MAKRRRRERIYIVPRWSGLVFAFILLLIFALGFADPSVRDLTQPLGIALLVAGVVALIQTNENLSRVEITASHSTPTAAGETAQIEITLHNGASRERIGLEVRLAMQWRTAWRNRHQATAPLPMMEPSETSTIRFPLVTAKRGRYALPDLWVSSVLPVGLCFAWKSFAGRGEYFVYPQPRGVPLEPDSSQGKLEGDGLAGGDQDVSGHRPYEPGDPLSRLDWRVFARTGKLAVRTLETGVGGEIVLRWEDARFVEDHEKRLEQLSCWIEQCVREERPFRLELPGSSGELSSRNVAACREALAIFEELPR